MSRLLRERGVREEGQRCPDLCHRSIAGLEAVRDKPVRCGVDAIEVVPTGAPGGGDRKDELLKSVAFWCAVCQA